MMGGESFFVDVDDLSDVRVTREMVAATDDTDLLLYWFDSLDERAVQIKEFLAAFREVRADDTSWLHRTCSAMAYNKIGLKWVERRLLALGVTPPYPNDDPRGQEIKKLLDRISQLKAENERLSLASVDTDRMAETALAGSGRSLGSAVGSEADETPTPSEEQPQ